MTYLLINK